MVREIRLRYRDLALALMAALLLDAISVALVYAIDLSAIGPLRRFYGPWGLPCLDAAHCPAPCAENGGNTQRPTDASRLDGP
jgi:hypothetical protein